MSDRPVEKLVLQKIEKASLLGSKGLQIFMQQRVTALFAKPLVWHFHTIREAMVQMEQMSVTQLNKHCENKN